MTYASLLSALVTLGVVAPPQLPVPLLGPPKLSLSVKEKLHVAGTFAAGVVTLRFDSKNRPGAAASLTVVRIGIGKPVPILHLETDQKSFVTIELWGGTLKLTNGSAGPLQKGSPADIARLLHAPELMTLLPLSFALASAGMTGRQWPGTLPLYMTALRIARFYDAHPAYRPMKVITNPDLSCVTPEGRRGLLDLCCDGQGCPRSCGGCRPLPQQPATACQSMFACKGSDCLGMCGPGCDCWTFVCEDCCCNKGCLNHDVASGMCDPENPERLWNCLRYFSGDAGVPLFECGGCAGCQK